MTYNLKHFFKCACLDFRDIIFETVNVLLVASVEKSFSPIMEHHGASGVA